MMSHATLFFLFIWSGTVLRIFLAVSVVVLALYIFFLQNHHARISDEVTRMLEKKDPQSCDAFHAEVNRRLNAGDRRIRTLKILWVAIFVLSCVLFVTFD